MKKIAVFLCLVLLLYSFPVSVFAAEPGTLPNKSDSKLYDELFPSSDNTVKILFIGNSYTYYNNFCATFTNLCNIAGKSVSVRQVTKGSHSLSQVANPKDLEGARVRNLLSTQKWDYVVLQDRHRYPIKKPQRIANAIETLQPYITASGAKMILFMSWAPLKGHRDYKKLSHIVPTKAAYERKLKETFTNLAAKYNAIVAPVGTAFSKCQKKYPNIRLIRKDKSHPTATGSYLSACVMYQTIFGTPAKGLTYKANLPAARAKKLQRIAATVMN